jgi:hypothetical protein
MTWAFLSSNKRAPTSDSIGGVVITAAAFVRSIVAGKAWGPFEVLGTATDEASGTTTEDEDAGGAAAAFVRSITGPAWGPLVAEATTEDEASGTTTEDEETAATGPKG